MSIIIIILQIILGIFFIMTGSKILSGAMKQDFAKLGWKTIVVGIVILLSTYVGSALVAEIVLRIQGLA